MKRPGPSRLARRSGVLLAAALLGGWPPLSASPGPLQVLNPEAFRAHIDKFNALDPQSLPHFVPNREAWGWLQDHVPFFACPDPEVEELYYFRWWSFRKHLVRTPQGFAVTEFLTPVKHAGAFNTISCAVGHHLAEGRWLRDPRPLDDLTLFWLRGHEGRPQPHFHKYSSWFAAAVYDRFLVNAQRAFVTPLLHDLVADYDAWEKERRRPDGLFWQFDVQDGMEESLSGSRTQRNARPTINSYMFGNAQAIAAIARLADQDDVARDFESRAAVLRRLTLAQLWDPSHAAFKVRAEDGRLADAREAIGFIPWIFGLPEKNEGYEAAWAQLTDPAGFRAPWGLTTAERRHPRFRSHGVGTCEWDGAVWPFATSQTLTALARVLHEYPQSVVTRRDYFDAFLTYVHAQHAQGAPYIGEYLDETTGAWIDGKNDRSRYYNHSTFADLIITGVVGLRPRADDRVEVEPLLPEGVWTTFCLDGVRYHGRTLTILWDQDGARYRRGAGLTVLADGKPIAHADALRPISGRLP